MEIEIPNEIISEILKYFTSLERSRLCTVSSRWCRCAIAVGRQGFPYPYLWDIANTETTSIGLQKLVYITRRQYAPIGYKYRKMDALRIIMNDEHLVRRLKNTRITTLVNRCLADDVILDVVKLISNLRMEKYEIKEKYTGTTISIVADDDEGGDNVIIKCGYNMCYTGGAFIEDIWDPKFIKYAVISGNIDLVDKIWETSHVMSQDFLRKHIIKGLAVRQLPHMLKHVSGYLDAGTQTPLSWKYQQHKYVHPVETDIQRVLAINRICKYYTDDDYLALKPLLNMNSLHTAVYAACSSENIAAVRALFKIAEDSNFLWSLREYCAGAYDDLDGDITNKFAAELEKLVNDSVGCPKRADVFNDLYPIQLGEDELVYRR